MLIRVRQIDVGVNTSRLIWSSVAASLVTLGVILKNGIEQAGWGKTPAMASGLPVFVVGWIMVAVALSRGKPGRPAEMAGVWLTSMTILATSVASSVAMSRGERPHLALPISFGLAWLGLGWLSGDTTTARMVGLVGAVAIIASMVFLMPLQREYCVTDGPGMPLFVLGWTVIVLVHSIVGYFPYIYSR